MALANRKFSGVCAWRVNEDRKLAKQDAVVHNGATLRLKDDLLAVVKGVVCPRMMSTDLDGLICKIDCGAMDRRLRGS